jgi:adenylate cyclase
MATTRRSRSDPGGRRRELLRLMGADEGTHERLRAHFREFLDPKMKEHHCRTVENTGDRLLAELPSVVEAARCAIEMRRAIHEQMRV